jgi:tetratricopeptide (TPR) repeat protein
VEIFRYNVKRHPESANVYDSLAEALETAGRHEEALANYNRAVSKAKNNDDPRLEIFRANRDRAMNRAGEEARD